VDGLAQVWQFLHRQLVGWQVDHKCERLLTRSLDGRSYDVIFGIVIEVTVTKRRWIKRIEQLLQSAEVDLDLCSRGRDIALVSIMTQGVC
jgi:hypothetical protein